MLRSSYELLHIANVFTKVRSAAWAWVGLKGGAFITDFPDFLTDVGWVDLDFDFLFQGLFLHKHKVVLYCHMKFETQ